MDAPHALAEVCSAAARVADEWYQIRENNADAPWEDFSFYKGNARWAAGVRADLAALPASRFASAAEVCDAAERLVQNRGWDGDYDPPEAARGELLAAIAEVRAKVGNREGERGADPEPPPAPILAAGPNPSSPSAGGAPYRSPPRPGPTPARYDARRPVGVVFTALVVGAVLLTLFMASLPGQTPFGRLVGLVFALPAAFVFWLRVRTVIHEDRVEQGSALWRRTLRLDDVVHVFDDGIDPMAQTTRLSSDLGSVVLAGEGGTTVRLTADIPRDVREDAIEVALAAAVRAAEAEIARGGSYSGPSGLVELDAGTLHGFRVGLTVSPASIPLAEIAEIGPGGWVAGRDGAKICIGEGDRVLAALLRGRGIGARSGIAHAHGRGEREDERG